MQAQPFAPAHPHPDLQPFEPIEVMFSFAIHLPALPAQHDVNALVPEPRTVQPDLPDAQAQRRLIPGAALAILLSPADPSEPTRPHRTHVEPLVNPMRDLPAA